MAKLDRLRLITLLPGNRIRLNVARDFDWRPRGPIRMFFLSHGLNDFLAGDFSREDESLSFSHAMLTKSAMANMLSEIRKLRQRFAELHEESLATPLSKRHGTGMLLAIKEWEIRHLLNCVDNTVRSANRAPSCVFPHFRRRRRAVIPSGLDDNHCCFVTVESLDSAIKTAINRKSENSLLTTTCVLQEAPNGKYHN